MATLVTDPGLERQIRAQRAEWGGDRYDEVWEGTYLMNPSPNLEHAEIQAGLSTAFRLVLGLLHPAKVYPGINVSDRADDWTKNYRCPDVVVIFPTNPGRDCGAYFLGGPDLLVEILGPYDPSREKIAFYERIGVRELLIVDRDPWRLELHRLRNGKLQLVGRAELEAADVLASDVLPVSLRLVSGAERPRIEVRHADGAQQWLA
ncbi:MAG TPA: Uma2 family endonuclease [Pirellulales bacterium]|jgi:Uma2 family endonuclease|nr:Uma2 family endonuclease [Pirellulales bacterium]